MVDAIVIGAGLFGQIIARGLMETGRKVHILDNQEPHAGSPPAACLIRKEWSGKLPEGVFDTGMKWLMDHYLLHEKKLHQFGNTKISKVTAFWFDPKDLLAHRSACAAKADPPTQDGKRWTVGAQFSDGYTELYEKVPLVVVAAGIWSQQLVPWYNMQLVGKAGLATLYRDVKQPNFIVPWAPYKQIVGFDRGDGYWVSDGSAILTDNWSDQRKRESRDRCNLQLKAEPENRLVSKELFGIRPYTVQQPCICEQVKPGLWVAVGARKNGTLLGAWCAQKIAKEST